MKKFRSEDLIDKLQHDIRQLLLAAEHFRPIDKIKLGYAPNETAWSVAQVLEHLNAYNRHYLPLMEKELAIIPKELNAWFVPGFFGEYFTNAMTPKNVFEIKNKMKAAKDFRPERTLDVEAVLNEFVSHQNKLLQLLELARKRNLNTSHIPITLTRLIKLKIGDLFRFLIAHEQRHMIQARNTIKELGIATDKFPVILQVAPQQPA